MSPLGKYYVGALIAIVILWILPLPGLVTTLLVLGLLGAPVAAYFMLDQSQRDRLRRIRRRQIGG